MNQAEVRKDKIEVSVEGQREDIIFELHPKEVELLKAIRTKFRYGEITIITRDGLPFRIRKTTEYDDLANES